MTVPAWIFAQGEHGDTPRGRSATGQDALRDDIPRDDAAAGLLRLAPDHSDYAAVVGVRAGDQRAFEAVYRMYFESLCDFALIYLRRPDLCGDIVNDVFANVWANRARWSPELGIGPYLRGAVRNRVRNALRDAVRAEQRTDAWVIGAPVESPAPDAALELRETAARVWRAVAMLPATRQLVITLRWQQQLGIPEIATHLGMSEGAVRVQLSRGLAQLRGMLPELFGE